MTYEEIEANFETLMQATFIPFFKERGFKIRQKNFVKQLGDIYQVFYVDTYMPKRKTGTKNMLIQPQIGFFNPDICEIIWPNENRNKPKLQNGFIQYDLGLYSGQTFYSIGQLAKTNLDELITTIKIQLNSVVASMFDEYKSLNDINLFMQANKKGNSVDAIYAPHKNETEYETAYKRFYYGLVAFYLYTKQNNKAAEILKRKHTELMTPSPVNRPTLIDGKYIDNVTMELTDFYKDLPFIERLCQAYGLNLNN